MLQLMICNSEMAEDNAVYHLQIKLPQFSESSTAPSFDILEALSACKNYARNTCFYPTLAALPAEAVNRLSQGHAMQINPLREN